MASSVVDKGRKQPGTYVLLFRLDSELSLPTGSLGLTVYPSGWYAYVGSAMGGLAGRIRHHLRPHQRPHWHIDYLLPHGAAAMVIVGPATRRLECLVAGALARRFQVLRRFGSSDCRCPGHLFHDDEARPIVTTALEALRCLGCEPREYHLSAAGLNDANASL